MSLLGGNAVTTGGKLNEGEAVKGARGCEDGELIQRDELLRGRLEIKKIKISTGGGDG